MSSMHLRSVLVMALLVFLPALAMSVQLGVKDAITGKYCIVLRANISGTIHYLDKAGVDHAVDFKVPNQVPPTEVQKELSSCNVNGSANTQRMVISFKPFGNDLEANKSWRLALNFSATDAKDHYSLSDYSLDVEFYDSQKAPNTTYLYKKAPTFKPEWGASMVKEQNQFIAFGCSQNSLSLTNQSKLNFDNMEVVAFAKLISEDFKGVMGVESCLLDQRTSDLIPIIVGACLAGLVVIVLIAYLIGRARAKRQGYASV